MHQCEVKDMPLCVRVCGAREDITIGIFPQRSTRLCVWFFVESANTPSAAPVAVVDECICEWSGADDVSSFTMLSRDARFVECIVFCHVRLRAACVSCSVVSRPTRTRRTSSILKGSGIPV